MGGCWTTGKLRNSFCMVIGVWTIVCSGGVTDERSLRCEGQKWLRDKLGREMDQNLAAQWKFGSKGTQTGLSWSWPNLLGPHFLPKWSRFEHNFIWLDLHWSVWYDCFHRTNSRSVNRTLIWLLTGTRPLFQSSMLSAVQSPAPPRMFPAPCGETFDLKRGRFKHLT